MSRVQGMQKELDQIGTIKDLTSVFESIASIHISQIKDKVVSSTSFFNQLWGIYTQIRVTDKDHIGSLATGRLDKPVIIVVTSDGGLIGDIDEKIMRVVMQDPKIDTADIVLVGAHGATLLTQNHKTAKKVFELPNIEQGESIAPIAKLVARYRRALVYYQTYISLSHQEVAHLDLFSAVAALGRGQSTDGVDIISSRDYIFEPSLEEILHYMESVMLEIAMGQVILESKLAQYASRFNAMSAAKQKANELRGDMSMALHRAKRAVGDERTKEVMSAMKLMGGEG